MSQALHALMHGVVDYAGLFPPAGLAVPVAVAEYAAHRTSVESWMLGRFIAPAAQLPVIAQAAAPHLVSGQVWPVSAIIGDRKSAKTSLAALADQGQAVVLASEGGLKVEVLETPLPMDVISGPGVRSFLKDFRTELLASSGFGNCELFIEVDSGPGAAEIIPAIAEFATDEDCRNAGILRVGTKLRTGGLVAAAFPSCAEIATRIAACRGEQLPMKFTAGLHHPIRHRNTGIDVMMHGFLNVFGAGLLAHSHDLPIPEISLIIKETNPSAFGFDETGFAWQDLKVEIGAIRSIRSRYLCGFGSCSFDEPRDDLFGLGLL